MVGMDQLEAQFDLKTFFEVETDTVQAFQELLVLESKVQGLLAAQDASAPVIYQGQWSEWAMDYLKTTLRALRVRLGVQGHAIWHEVARVGVLTDNVKLAIDGVVGRLNVLDQNVTALTQRLGTVEENLNSVKERLAAIERQNQMMMQQNLLMSQQNGMIFRHMEAMTCQMDTIVRTMGDMTTHMGAMTAQMGAMAADITALKIAQGIHIPANVVQHGFQQGQAGQYGGMAPAVGQYGGMAVPVGQYGGTAPPVQVFPTFASRGLSSMAEFNAMYPA